MDVIGILETKIATEEEDELLIQYLSEGKEDYEWTGVRRGNTRSEANGGGVGMLLRKDLHWETLQKSKQGGKIWIEVQLPARRKLLICLVYMPPSASEYAKESDDIMDELRVEIPKYMDRGDVVVMGDLNARIGSLPSITGHDKAWERVSEDTKTTSRGRKVLELLNQNNLVVLNGVKEKGLWTYVKKGGSGCSVIDYICLSEELMQKAVGMEYIPTESEHHLILAEIEIPEPPHDARENCSDRTIGRRRGLRKTSTKRWMVDDRGDGTYWQPLQAASEYYLPRWCSRDQRENGMHAGEPRVAQLVTDGTKLIRWVAQKSLGKTRGRGGSGGRSTRSGRHERKTGTNDHLIVQLKRERKELYQRILRLGPKSAEARELWRKEKRVKKDIKKRRGELETEKRRAIQQTIQQMKKRNDGKNYWNVLLMMSNTRKKRSKKASLEVKNDQGEVVRQEEAMKVWKEAYERLGKGTEEKGRFDDEFKELLELVVEKTENEEMRDEMKREARDSCLNCDLSLKEVATAVKALKRRKAGGVDHIVSEILKYGGEEMISVVWYMCSCAWKHECVPKQWSKGLIFPIHKDGNAHDPLNYRPITLLSVVGKVYTSVLHRRLQQWCEGRGIIAEEQNGFRPGRSTIDHLFTLSELIRMRQEDGHGRGRTIACFIDITKAYDSVWRDGLWHKLHECGIRGKMYRAVKSLYASVESAVVVDEFQSDWFGVEVGLRQGCILSPLLFLIFINDIVSHLQVTERVGVEVGSIRVSVLLYADDIVLLARNETEMEELWRGIERYCELWRLKINQRKTAVMTFGGGKKQCTVRNRDGTEVKETDRYKYLGLLVTTKHSRKEMKQNMVEKARKRLNCMWAVGANSHHLNASTLSTIWKVVVKPALEYGCEIWGEEKWEEAERVQRKMGRMILEVKQRTSSDVVLGELGWWKMKAERDFRRICYWYHLATMHSSRLPNRIYREGRKRYQLKDREGKTQAKSDWCLHTAVMMGRYGLSHYWENEQTLKEISPQEWREIVRDAVGKIEEKEWKERMESSSKLKTYRTLKTNLGFAHYLNNQDAEGRRLMTMLRSGTNDFGIEEGRWKEDRGRFCYLCAAEVEDEKHLLLDCPAYHEERMRMIKQMNIRTQQWERLVDVNKLRIICNNRNAVSLEAAFKFVKSAIRKRTTLMRVVK